MSQPQQHHPDVEAKVLADKIANSPLALVEFRDQWFRASGKLDPRQTQFFDTIVVVKGNEYTVLKDRRGFRTGYASMIDILKVKLFANGKTLNDLPEYYEDPSTTRRGPLNLAMDAKGNLVAVCAFNDDDPRS